jgi:CubicO group peptidase (beta-lactamase class C family)
MTISDWAKFATLHLRGDHTNPHTHPALLKSESFAVLHTALFGGAYAGGWGTAARPAWGKGSRETDQGRVLTHAGSNTLWFCVVWLAPEIDFAVLVACNQGGPEATKACDAAAGALIQEFGRKPARP